MHATKNGRTAATKPVADIPLNPGWFIEILFFMANDL